MRNGAERVMLDSGRHFSPSFPPSSGQGAQAPAPSILVVVVADVRGLEQVLGNAGVVGRPVHVIQNGPELDALLTEIRQSMRATPPALVKVGASTWFDADSGELVINDTRVALTPSEAEILNILLQHQKVWLRAFQLADKVAEQLERDDVSPHTVETNISTLRAKGIPIHNKYGRGYRLMLVKELPRHTTPE